MSYRVFQIQNSEGKNIGKKQYYSTLGNAKNASHNCIWRMDKGSKIVELEVNEVPISKINIIVKEVESTWRPGSFNTELVGFESQDTITKEDKQNPIKFN